MSGETTAQDARGTRLAKLALGAVGIVYGDIGTSPLYAMRECFDAEHGVAPTEANVLGITSLVFWSLAIVVVLKYLFFMMRADNDGDGGILALLSLAAPRTSRPRTKRAAALVALGLFGAALLYGDAVITPALSVLGAIEGLAVADARLHDATVWISALILLSLFACQRFGTGRLGLLFGVVMVGWFVAIAALGVPWIAQRPEILAAASPLHALTFFAHNGFHGFYVLGAVVLCVTGGEALYADMGHFGRRAIRLAWALVVYPALLLNYFGQGAFLLASPAEHTRPFYGMVPSALVLPMVVLATAAAVIASQALISGAFSMSHQAASLGYFPRVLTVHTSSEERGQIYVPAINQLMMVACLVLVVTFRSSSALAAAYGAAVTGTMTITSILFYSAMHPRIGKPAAAAITALFLSFDLSFLAANALKLVHGGWVPISIALSVFTVMMTWHRGRLLLGERLGRRSRQLGSFLDWLDTAPPLRVEGTGVFMTGVRGVAPPALIHQLRHGRVLPERVVLLTVLTANIPRIPRERRVDLMELRHEFWVVAARYGFADVPSIADIASACAEKGLVLSLEEGDDDVTFYLGRSTLLDTGRGRMMRWRKRLFAFLARNSRPPTFHYCIPPDRVVEMGQQVEL